MVEQRHRGIPAALVRGRDRFEAWRRARKLGARIPDELWLLAVTLADEHGTRLRVHLRGCDVPDVVALGRSFWSGE